MNPPPPLRRLWARLAPAPAAHGTARAGLWPCLLLVLLCMAFATQHRLAQLRLWQQDAAGYVANGVPMMTTLDAWYSLRLARLQARGEFVPHGPAPQRHYTRPEQGDPDTWYEQREPRVLPLLSRLIAVMSPLAGGDIDRTALWLIPCLSSLFMLPLFGCLWRLGAPAAGVMGGLIGTFCLTYLQRSSAGWVDTDALNLMFPWLASWLLMCMHGRLERDRLLLVALATGMVLHLSWLWYPKPAITLLYAASAALHLRLAGVAWRRVVACLAVMLLSANPLQLADALGSVGEQLQRYLGLRAHSVVAEGLRFPSVWPTITEDRVTSWSQKLSEVLARPAWAAAGLLACVPFLLWHWRRAAPLMPLLALAALALLSSRRFVPYLAPLVGIGWGLLVALALRALPLERLRPAWRATAGTAAAIGVFALWLLPLTGVAYRPVPAVPAPVFRDLQQLARQLPADTRLWTWWDLGFAIQDATGRGVYHDGAAQYTPQTNLVAASLVHASPQVLHDTIGFVDREGNAGILRLARASSTMDELLQRIAREPRRPAAVPVHLLFTADMLGKYNAMRTLARVPPAPPAVGVQALACTRAEAARLHCAGQVIDLAAGLIQPEQAVPGRPLPQARLRRIVVASPGVGVRRETDFPDAPDARLTLELIQDDSGIRAVYLLDEEAFASNLNQMYLLGRHDATRFERVHDGFPYTRTYRWRTPGE